jgi:glycosyltransferase involved in cell wall biosynthesis
MKKILYIVSTLKRSGPINQLYYLIKYLDRTQFEPHLITLSPEPEDNKESRWSDYKSLGVYLYSLNLSRFEGIFIAYRHIQSIITKINPDIVHSQGFRGDALISKLPIVVPKISTVRNFPQIDYLMTYGRLIGKLMCIVHTRCLRKMTVCVGVSEAVTKNLEHYLKIKNVLTVRNGVDTELYFPVTNDKKELLRKKLNLPVKGRIWISSGHLSERKNPLFLIRAWKNLGLEGDNYLIFIGSGKLLETCKQENFNCDNIYVIGRVNNVIEYLRAGDYFISASCAEGLPNAVLEAMACGLPVLLSDIEPHKEIINMANASGFYYMQDNMDSFNMSFKKCISMDKVKMSNAALTATREVFSASIMSRAYQEIYQNYFLRA